MSFGSSFNLPNICEKIDFFLYEYSRSKLVDQFSIRLEQKRRVYSSDYLYVSNLCLKRMSGKNLYSQRTMKTFYF